MPVLDRMGQVHSEAASGNTENLAETKVWLSKILKYNAGYGSGRVSTVTG